MSKELEPLKDSEAEHPVPSRWRPTLREIARRLASFDYSLEGIPSVECADDAAEQIEELVADYGETLVELPEETWETSVSTWTGFHWDVLVDLWTVESGASDMVLHVKVHEDGDGFRFEVHAVYVP